MEEKMRDFKQWEGFSGRLWKDGVILEDLKRTGSEDEFYGKIIEKMKDL